MAYKETNLEQQLKQSERLPVGWPWRLLVFTLLILGIMVAIYFGMLLGYKPYLNSKIRSLDAKIADLSKGIDEKEQQNMADFYSQLFNIQGLLESHPAGSKIFDLLEEKTHQQVYYFSTNLSLREKSLKLDGIATNYGVLTQQLELFQAVPEIEKVLLDDSHLMTGGGIQFSIRMTFKSELVK